MGDSDTAKTGKLENQSVRGYMHHNWPLYTSLYGGLVIAFVLIGAGLVFRWYSLISFAIALGLVTGYLLVASLWMVQQMYGNKDDTPAKILTSMSQLQPEERVACIDLGLRETPLFIAQFLTSGEVVAIDVFNPQSNMRPALRRARTGVERPTPDPRITWIDGSIDLLPLSDNSVSVVYLNEILSEFWLPNDQEKLLSEIWRILIPEGRLMVSEKVRSQNNLMVTGLLTASWPTESKWRSILVNSDFILQREEIRHGLILYLRAKKPSPASGKQMKLGLEYL